MRGRKIALTVILVVTAALLLGIGGWYLWNLYSIHTLHSAIEEAWNRDDTRKIPEYLEYLDEHSSFEIDSVIKGDGPWQVTVTVHGLDLADELERRDPKKFAPDEDPDEIDEYILSLAKKADPMERTTVIYAWPEEDGYRIRFSETFIDAMTGGVYSYVLELVDDITGGSR